ncbi:MAG: isoprenylcysteine carboxylmethyltransferase family protein [Nanoarchaeota archaeon]|nr:isoprenylcysteine carboxylmethyltransferase family protein [Nanoarchaeota archaeon]
MGKIDDPDRDSLPIIIVTLGVILLCVVSEVMVRRPGYVPAFVLSGLVVFVTGFALRLSAQFQLGKNFALRVMILPDHSLVDSGIYSLIRHPMYSGLFMIVLGLCLALQSWFGIAATVILLIPAGIYRMDVEEAALRSKFGKRYRCYMQGTKRCIPFIW